MFGLRKYAYDNDPAGDTIPPEGPSPLWRGVLDGFAAAPPEPCPVHMRSTAWGSLVRGCVHEIGHVDGHEFETLERAAVRSVAEILHVAATRVGVSWRPTDGSRPAAIRGVTVDGLVIGEGAWVSLIEARLPMLRWSVEAKRCSTCFCAPGEDHRYVEGRPHHDDLGTKREFPADRLVPLISAVDAVTGWADQAPGDLCELARRIGALAEARRAL